MRCLGSSEHTNPVSSRRFTKCSLVTRLSMNGSGPVSPTRESQPSHTAVTITLFATGRSQSGAHFGRFDSSTDDYGECELPADGPAARLANRCPGRRLRGSLLRLHAASWPPGRPLTHTSASRPRGLPIRASQGGAGSHRPQGEPTTPRRRG